ncbi:hypothetical protein K2173_000602 [Erythroxylum novogranatense]|uniref:IBH1-like N-terminal domain-containing protein n=1 Tax=Erythroxylum novogranatense TaxID=1862640 RepID=A0AAV8S7R3_9ROSI|nr:hypothetical protein K2173_000602 [Erythroxylum novogranatense]
MNPHRQSTNPNWMKSRFAGALLRALTKIRAQKPSSCSPRDVFQRYRRVKLAADKSLVFAVGLRRTWSRALLCKIRNQERRRKSLARRIKTQPIKKCEVKEKMNGEEDDIGQANELRKLVPGGESMDLCGLFEEAAHYIRCLNTQVQVMRSIVDLYST